MELACAARRVEAAGSAIVVGLALASKSSSVICRVVNIAVAAAVRGGAAHSTVQARLATARVDLNAAVVIRSVTRQALANSQIPYVAAHAGHRVAAQSRRRRRRGIQGG